MPKQDRFHPHDVVTENALGGADAHRLPEETPAQAPIKCRVGFGPKTVVPGVEGQVGFMWGVWVQDKRWAELEVNTAEHGKATVLVTPEQALITVFGPVR